MPIPTYFSHSYRLEDQDTNRMFWRLFSAADFSFFVDPPSDATIHAHLERMMNRCSAFVAIANRRRGVSRYHCSRFVLYEYGLSIQARRPRLILVDRRVDLEPFARLPPEQVHVFAPDEPDRLRDELASKIERLRQVAIRFPNRLDEGRKPIAILAPADRSQCVYARPEILRQIEEAADLSGFRIVVVTIPYTHNAFFALDLDGFEAVILDVRGEDLPEWAFAYVYGRLTPTIKLARLQPDELAWSVPLPPLVAGLRLDESEPGVESVTYWRDAGDLVFQLSRAFQKLDEEQTQFKYGRQGELYFDSIGRRPAKVFISNSSRQQDLARRLSEQLRLRNIEQFHYKDDGAIRVGSNWREKILRELRACDVFIALIGEGYAHSEWCMEEVRTARGRIPDIDLLPYNIGGADVRFMKELQAPDLPADTEAATERVLGDIQNVLLGARGATNRRQRKTILLGGAREAIVDGIRHLSSRGLAALTGKMAELGVALDAPDDAGPPVKTREFAETLFSRVQRADADPNRAVAAIPVLTQILAEQSADPRNTILGVLAARFSASDSHAE